MRVETDRVRLSHIERIISAEAQSVRTVAGDKMVEFGAVKHQSVEPDLAEIARRSAGDVLAAVFAGAPGVVHSAPIPRQISAAMCHAELETGVAVEHAFENQVTESDGRFNRVADDVVEIMFGQALPVGEAERVEEQQNAEFFCGGKEGAEFGGREFLTVDVAADLDPAQAKIVHAAAHFSDGEFGRLQRHGAHADEPVRMRCTCRRDAVIDQPAGFTANLWRGEVEILPRRGADRLHINAEPVHIRQSRFDAVELWANGGEQRAIDLV